LKKEKIMAIAVLGGTGNLGFALARRWASAGKSIVIGSRSAENAIKAAAEMRAEVIARGVTADIRGDENAAAAAAADIVVLTVPFASQRAVLEHVKPHLAGKVLIDTTVPLVPPKVMRAQMPPEGSAAMLAAGLVGENVRVVSAFHNVPADVIRGDAEVECDVLVFGDDRAARQDAVDLAEAAGLTAYHAGPLVNSMSAEALTSVLIFLNKNYGGHAGIRLTGLGPA
jgi:NADPH-dependent F420 reductase